MATIDDSWEREVRNKLDAFACSDAPDLRFPPMENHKRKRIHELARRKQLNSTSSGRDPHRFCVITRRRRMNNMLSNTTAHETQAIELSKSQKSAIERLMSQMPIEQENIDEHLNLNELKKHRRSQSERRHSDEPLIPPRSSCSADMLSFRKKLPVFGMMQDILGAIDHNEVTLITGGTGCGKTTQVPQFLLEHYERDQRAIRIICTQPRRLPAIAVAERVSEERGEKLGGTVGYHIRLEQRTSAQTILTYCTSGVLLRMLTQDDVSCGATHIILDEVHEREQNTDYLLIALREALSKKRGLKVVLMSATMEGNIGMFMSYFSKHRIQHIDVPSRLFNVERFHLGEVLTMCSYNPPASAFGSMGHFETGSFVGSGVSSSSRFPPVENWSSCASFSNGNFGKGTGHMTGVQTAPNLAALQPRPGLQPTANMGAIPASASMNNLQQKNIDRVAHQLASTIAHPSGPQLVNRQCVGYYTAHQQHYGHPQSQIPWHTSEGTRDDVEDMVASDEEGTAQHGGMHAAAPAFMQQAGGYNQNQPQRGIGMGHHAYSSARGMEWQPHNQQGQPAWTHTQSFSEIPLQVSTGGTELQHWQAGGPIYQQAPFQAQQATFYVDDGSGYAAAQPMDHSGAPYSSIYAPNVFSGFPGPSSSQVLKQPTDPDVQSFSSTLTRERQEEELMRNRMANGPFKGRIFGRDVVSTLRRMPINESEIVNTYLKLGGSAWVDNVDQDLCKSLIDYLIDADIPGAILVFLPGFDDINTVRLKIETDIQEHKYAYVKPVVYCLHSQMNSSEQQRIFENLGHGFRKVILSTNIAEASLTIDDVVFVIDSGKVKEKTYDHESRISQLKVQWIAKSNAEQRSGRAGRCREGFCFRLYPQNEYEAFLPTQIAEMQRAAIHDVCLHAKMFAPENMTVKQFLDLAPEPPRQEAVDNSLQFLEQLGALYNEKANKSEAESSIYQRFSSMRFGGPNRDAERSQEPSLTSLGRLVAQLPLEPQLARLLLFGVTLKCFNPIATLVAMLSHREPFIITVGEQRTLAQEARDEFGRRDLSDHLMLVRTFNEYTRIHQRATHAWCRNKYIQPNVMKMIAGIRRQLITELRRAGVIRGDLDDPELNWNSDSWPMVQAAIVAGCYPGIGFVKSGNKLRKIRTSNENNAQLHPSSCVKRQVQPGRIGGELSKRFNDDESETRMEFVVFQEMARLDTGLTLRCVTVVPPLSVVLFAGAIRLKKSTIDCFNIVCLEGEEPEITEEKTETEVAGFGGCMSDLYVLDLEQWLAVKGPYQELRRVMQLRFRIMDYFLSVMKQPAILYEDRYDALLQVLREVLEEEHTRFYFNRVTDLPEYSKPSRQERSERKEKEREDEKSAQSRSRDDQSSDVRTARSNHSFASSSRVAYSHEEEPFARRERDEYARKEDHPASRREDHPPPRRDDHRPPRREDQPSSRREDHPLPMKDDNSQQKGEEYPQRRREANRPANASEEPLRRRGDIGGQRGGTRGAPSFQKDPSDRSIRSGDVRVQQQRGEEIESRRRNDGGRGYEDRKDRDWEGGLHPSSHHSARTNERSCFHARTHRPSPRVHPHNDAYNVDEHPDDPPHSSHHDDYEDRGRFRRERDHLQQQHNRRLEYLPHPPQYDDEYDDDEYDGEQPSWDNCGYNASSVKSGYSGSSRNREFVRGGGGKRSGGPGGSSQRDNGGDWKRTRGRGGGCNGGSRGGRGGRGHGGGKKTFGDGWNQSRSDGERRHDNNY